VKYGRFMAAIIASKVLREPSFLKVRPMRTFAALSLVLVGTSASAQEMKVPQTTSASVDWPAVRASIQLPAINRLPPIPDGPGSESGLRIASEGGPLGRLNQSISPIFPAVALSTVPVLMPLDMPRYLSDLARNEVEKTDVYTSGFKSKVFVPGRAGYDAAFRYTPNKNVKPIEVQISGSSITYELTTPANSNLRNRSRSSEKAVPVSQDLVSKYPGIRKLIHENYIPYTFVRHRVPYVISAECKEKDEPCNEVNHALEVCLRSLQLLGGTPAIYSKKPVSLIERPEKVSRFFTYYSPGDLLDGTGYAKGPGQADFTVYANINFPIAHAPTYANSQVFMNGGDCGSESDPHDLQTKNQVYSCKVNGKPLLYFEGNTGNFAYPWRNNFCESRSWPAGQCPSGYGHQGQDIRPGLQKNFGASGCVVDRKNSIKCAPYQHDLVAASDSYVWRSDGGQALILIVNESNEHVKLRYLHMDPKRMDKAGLDIFKERYVYGGDKLGEVGNYEGGKPGGTTYHVHVDMQVPARVGWVFVNPYMTLIAAYERLIGGRGTQCWRGEPQGC
jgi:hypothetical protein